MASTNVRLLSTAKYIRNRAKCHWDPRSEHPLFALCDVFHYVGAMMSKLSWPLSSLYLVQRPRFPVDLHFSQQRRNDLREAVAHGRDAPATTQSRTPRETAPTATIAHALLSSSLAPYQTLQLPSRCCHRPQTSLIVGRRDVLYVTPAIRGTALIFLWHW